MADVRLQRPPEWTHSRRGQHAPARLVDVDLDGRTIHAIRLEVRPTHTTRSVVMTVLGLVFAAVAIGAIVLSIMDPAWDAIVGSIVLVGFATLFLFGGLLDILAARRGLGLDLTPDDVTVGLGHTRTAIAWDDVTEVRAFSIPHHGDWLGIATADGESDLAAAVACRKLKSDPLIAYHGVRYYADHPESRGELAGEDGVRRLNGGHLA